MINFVDNNGEILKGDNFTIRTGSRAFLYGDGVFESIRIVNGRAINLENHVNRMIEGAKAIKMRPPSYFNVSFFEERIQQLIERSKIVGGGRCRISLDRVAGGTYTPESNEVSYFIEVYPLNNNAFELNKRGLEIDVYQDHRKSKCKLSNYKTKNALVYVLASIAAKEKGLDDLLITNDAQSIIEGSSSNLFVVSNGVLYTPGLEEGCLAGTMRMQVINLALKNGMKVYECSIMPQNLLAADEIFLTNAIQGIVWVSGYRTKRYFSNTAKKMIELLNQTWLDVELH